MASPVWELKRAFNNTALIIIGLFFSSSILNNDENNIVIFDLMPILIKIKSIVKFYSI